MPLHPRIECPDLATFTTTRTRSSELWFTPSKALSDTILGYLAKYTTRDNVKLYASSIQGSHIHLLAHFPDANRAAFMRDFNSMTARTLPRHFGKQYTGGRPWGRRYSGEYIGDNAAIEKKFFYTALQPVQDGLVEKISDWPGYNCFHDAIWGVKRKFTTTDWAAYNEAKRRNKGVPIKIADFRRTYTLQYERLPGYEHLSQKEYAKLMMVKLEERRQEVIEQRKIDGKTGFMGREAILNTVPGARAMNPKTSNPGGRRPRVFSSCPERRRLLLLWYFDKYWRYKEASKRYRAGELGVEFPEGMYRPPWVCIKDSGGAAAPGSF